MSFAPHSPQNLLLARGPIAPQRGHMIDISAPQCVQKRAVLEFSAWQKRHFIIAHLQDCPVAHQLARGEASITQQWFEVMLCYHIPALEVDQLAVF
jgi:hypothetical protein